MAAVRLLRIKEEYGDRVDITWRSFPLVVQHNPDMRLSPRSAEARRRADLEEQDVSFKPWNPSQSYPTSSLPALKAVKCAQLQGQPAFLRFHLALFRAFFEESRDISDRTVLISLAEETGLDVERFTTDFDREEQTDEVLAEYRDGWEKYAGWGIPLAIIGDRFPVVGAVPMALYRRAVDVCLSQSAG